MDDFGFSPPAFVASDALLKFERELRGLGLALRDGRFERRGVAIARAAVDGAVLSVAVVKKPSRSSPEWQARTLKDHAQLRDFVADLKKKLAGWSDRDD